MDTFKIKTTIQFQVDQLAAHSDFLFSWTIHIIKNSLTKMYWMKNNSKQYIKSSFLLQENKKFSNIINLKDKKIMVIKEKLNFWIVSYSILIIEIIIVLTFDLKKEIPKNLKVMSSKPWSSLQRTKGKVQEHTETLILSPVPTLSNYYHTDMTTTVRCENF